MSDVVGGAAVVVIPDVSGFAEALTAAIGPALDSAQSMADDFSSQFATDLSSIADAASSTAGDLASSFQDAFTSIDDAASAVQVDIPIQADTETATADIDSVVAAAEGQQITIPVNVEIPDLATVDQELNSVADSSNNATSAVSGLADQAAALGSAASIAGGELGTVSGITDTVGAAMDGALGSVTGLASGLSDELKSALGGVGVALGSVTAGLGALGAFTDLVVGKAVTAESATQRFNLILGEQADAVNHVNLGGLNEDLSTMVNRLGSGTSAVRQADASLFQLGQQSDASGSDISKTVEQINVLTTRAVALNPQLGAVGDNVESLSKGLSRGGRFLAAYGLQLTSNEINTRALADTGKVLTSELTTYERTAAGAALATEKLGDRLGTDIKKGAENVTFDFQRIQLEFNKALVELGKPLISPTLDLLKSALPVGLQFAKILGTVAADTIPIVTSLFDAIGPLVQIVGGKLADAFKDIEPAVEATAKIFATSLSDPTTVNIFQTLGDAVIDLVHSVGSLLPLMANISTAEIQGSVALLALGLESVSVILNGIASTLQFIGVIQPTSLQKTAEQVTALAQAAKDNAVEKEVEATNKALSGTVDVLNKVLDTMDQANKATQIGADGFNFLALNINNLRNKSSAELDSVANNLGLNKDAFKKWKDDVVSFVDEVAKAAAGQLPKISDAFTFDGGKQLFDPATIELQLKNQAKAVQNFQGNLETLSAQGLDNLVNELLRQGPMVGGALAASLVAGAPDRARALNDQLQMTQTAFNSLTDWVTNVFGPKFAAESGNAAKSAVTDFGAGIGAATPIAESAARVAADRIQRELLGSLEDQARKAGYDAFVALKEGFEAGAVQAAAGAAAAAARVANAVSAAARAALGIASPSSVFNDIGQNTVLGLVQGLNAGHGDVSAALGNLVAAGTPGMASLGVLPSAVGYGGPQSSSVQFNIEVTVDGAGLTDERAAELGHAIGDAAVDAANEKMRVRAAIFAA